MTAKTQFQTRALAFAEAGADGRIPVVISSDAVVEVADGPEILAHQPGAINMERAPLPIIVTHEFNVMNVGIIEDLAIESGALRGFARFGQRPEAAQYEQDVRNGTIRAVSVGYVRNDGYVDKSGVLVTTRWTPRHVAMIGEPADSNAGFFRALSPSDQEFMPGRAPDEPHAGDPAAQTRAPGANTPPARAETLEQNIMTQPVTQPAAEPGTQQTDTKSEARGAEVERKRMIEIDAMCRAHSMPEDLRSGLISRGASIEEARGAVLDAKLKAGGQQASLGHSHAPDLSDKEKGHYSMIRAVNAALSGSWREAGFELEVSNEIAKRSGKPTSGFYMPTSLPFAMRAPLSAGAAATGGVLVATNLLAGAFIELLRNKARVLQLGATVLSGLVGNVDIPRQIGAGTAYWVGDANSVTESEPIFDKLSLAYKTIGAKGVIYRTMLAQSTPDAEMLLRADLLAIIALGIDAAALYGTASATVPGGIATTAGIGAVVGGTNGAALTIDHLIDLETQVTLANVDESNLSYLTNARAVGALKKLKSTTGQYLWSNNPMGQRSATPGEVNGYPVARSNQARSNLAKGTQDGSTEAKSCSEVFFGDFSQLVLAEWGVLEILPNALAEPYYSQGAVQLRALQSLDIGLRHPQAFARMGDAIVTA